MNPIRLTGYLVNGFLGWFGLRLSRVREAEENLDPVARAFAKGCSGRAHNSRENMDAFYADPELMTKYFDQDRLAFYAQVRDRIACLGLQPSMVLDVGCGSGHLLAELKKVLPAARLLGVDFSSESIRLARKLNPELRFEEMDIFDLEKTGQQFDLVVCTEVLEHLEDADLAVGKLVAACRPGGMLAITVPQGRRDSFAGHVNFWTSESFRREFRALDPQVEELGSYLFIMIRRLSAPCSH